MYVFDCVQSIEGDSVRYVCVGLPMCLHLIVFDPLVSTLFDKIVSVLLCLIDVRDHNIILSVLFSYQHCVHAEL